MTKPPQNHPDLKATEDALRAAYDAMVLRHMQAGWNEADVALGMEALAQEHIAQLGGRDAGEAIAMARAEALYTFDRQEGEGQRWMYAAGAAIWCALLFSLAFLAVWAIT